MTTANILSQLGSPGVSTGFKNRIINGSMVFDQRNAGASTTFNSSVAYGLDRWFSYGQSGSGHTLQQVSDAPAGFVNSLKITVGTGASPSASQQNIISQPIEGYNVADLNWGTANAKTVTFSFWVKSSVTGTMNIWVLNNGSLVSYVSTYTVNAANTWEYKTITIPGPTTGTWLTTNGAGLLVGFSLGMGSNYTATANTWSSGDLKATSGATAVIATSGATWQVTGCQFEVGTTATNFEVRSYGTELALCQRYFEKSYDITTAIATVTNVGRYGGDPGVHGDGTSAMTIFFKVAKRAPNYSAVTYSGAGTAGVMDYARSGASGTVGSAFDNRGQCSMLTYCTTGATAWTQTSVILFQWAVDSEL